MARRARPRVVLDTNILVSGLLNGSGPSGRVLDLAVGGALVVLYSAHTFAEYREVLIRPRFDFAIEDVVWLLARLRRHGRSVRRRARPLAIQLPDEGDRPFMDLARAGHADAIVTSNRRHFPRACDVPFLSATAFLRQLASERLQ